MRRLAAIAAALLVALGLLVALALLLVDPDELREPIVARASAVLYQITGRWTPAHEDGPVVVTATLRLQGGELLANSLRW